MPISATGTRVRRLHSLKGFTLLELLIVIAILGITLGYVGPKLYGGFSTSGMDKASRDITAMLQYARSSAVTQHQEYLVRFNLDEAELGVYARPTSSGLTPEMLKKRKLPEGIRIKSIKSPYKPTQQQGFFELSVTAEGLVEQGVIYLENSLGTVFTLEVKPFSGYLKIEDGFVEKIYG